MLVYDHSIHPKALEDCLVAYSRIYRRISSLQTQIQKRRSLREARHQIQVEFSKFQPQADMTEFWEFWECTFARMMQMRHQLFGERQQAS